MSALAGMETAFVDVPVAHLGRGSHPREAKVHTAHWAAAPDAPAGAPAQVCLHGLGGSHLNWALLGPLLAGDGPVWAPDLAGFGRTPPEGRTSSVGDNVDLVAGFIATVSPGRPVVLLGNSMGGHIAYSLAARRPDLVAGVILMGAAVPPMTRTPDATVLARFATFTLPYVGKAYLEAKARKLTPAEQVRETMELCSIDLATLDPDVLAAHVEMAAERRRMPHAHTSFLTAARSLLRRIGPRRRRLWSAVDAVSAPTLILQGSGDRLVERLAADRLSRRRPDWDYIVYDDHGHLVMLQAPERVAADIRAWRAEHLPLPDPRGA